MNKQKEKKEIGEIFMRFFVKNLIINSFKEQKEQLEKSQKSLQATQLTQPMLIPSLTQTTQTTQFLPQQITTKKIQQLRTTPQFQEISNAPKFSYPLSSQNPSRKFPSFPPQKKPEQFSVATTPTGDPLETILQILRDPAVLGVECPGPEKNILVNRGGAIQTAHIVLTKDNVDTVINTVSNITRVPVIPGVFKAVFHNYVITAIISEFVGTRFLIEKKMPRFVPPRY